MTPIRRVAASCATLPLCVVWLASVPSLGSLTLFGTKSDDGIDFHGRSSRQQRGDESDKNQ